MYRMLGLKTYTTNTTYNDKINEFKNEIPGITN